MGQAPYSMDGSSRAGVLEALKDVCVNRGWSLLAAHVQANHVHAIVEAEVQPEKVLNDFKAYASRKLNQLGRDQPGQKRWARHGSTRWLWSDQSVREAVKYVVEEQGEPMAVFVAGLI
jgi:REP element-mobilizing transposase RayT